MAQTLTPCNLGKCPHHLDHWLYMLPTVLNSPLRAYWSGPGPWPCVLPSAVTHLFSTSMHLIALAELATGLLSQRLWPVGQSMDTNTQTDNNFQFYMLWFDKAKSENNHKSKPPHPPKMKIIQNWSSLPHPSKVKTDKSQSFQDQHTLPMSKIIQIGNFKTCTSSQSITYPNQSFQDTTSLPKWEILRISPFNYYHILSK